MSELINVYCDESCHLEHDHQGVMVLGAVWCPQFRTPALAQEARNLKETFGLSPRFELKWGKVSSGRMDYYQAVLNWFWTTDDLHFRALLVPDKSQLDHDRFGQTHDDWYYKMYFDLLKVIIDPKQQYSIYLDLKDTRGAAKVQKLHEVLCNAQYDFSRSVIQKIQLIRSHEVELLQVTDFLSGLIAYVNRDLKTSGSKLKLVDQLQKASGYTLRRTTLLRENKINLFRWHAREVV